MKEVKKGLLLAGKPIPTSNLIYVHPLTLNEIYDIGYINVMYFIKMLSLSNVVDETSENENTTSDLEALKALMLSNQEVGIGLVQFLSMIFKERIIMNNNIFYVIDEKEENIREITEEAFKEIVEAIHLQYGIKSVDDIAEDEEDDPEIAKFKKRRKELNRIIEESNKNPQETQTLEDLISSICVANVGLNIKNIWDITIYQLYDQVSRYSAKTNADITVQSMFAGNTDAELKNWMGELNKNN